jgi:hypothetical protein
MIMKKLLLLFGCLLIVYSCEKNSLASENLSSSEVAFAGAIFESWESFHDYIIKLEALADENSVLYEIQNEKYTSFLSIALSSDEDNVFEVSENLTIGLMAVLNKNLQFMIDDKIITYKSGGFYESDLDLKSFKEINNIVVSIAEINDDENPNSLSSRIDLNNNETGGYSNRDFYRNSYRRCSDNALIRGRSPREMRFVQQLKSVYYQPQKGLAYTAVLYIETKLFYRNSKNQLRRATLEERNYTYNLNGSISMPLVGFSSYSKNISTNSISNVDCTKSQFNQVQIASAFPVGSKDDSWNININGAITHQINGDSSSNKWFASANW